MEIRPPNVLLVSNDEAETAALQHLLSEHVVLTPVNNESALAALLEKKHFDALFWAWPFHTATWNDALREVRKFDPDLPVIALSSAPEERGWLRAIDAGAFDLLVAPFEERPLLAVLEQASASHEARISRRRAPLLKSNGQFMRSSPPTEPRNR